MATRDFLRSELRSLLEEMEERGVSVASASELGDGSGDQPAERDGARPT